MKYSKALILAATFSIPMTVGALECRGSHRQITSGQEQVKTVVLSEMDKLGDTVTLAAQVDQRYFFATVLAQGADMLLQLTPVDTDQKGLVARMGFNSEGRAALSEVVGEEVYKLECRR